MQRQAKILAGGWLGPSGCLRKQPAWGGCRTTGLRSGASEGEEREAIWEEVSCCSCRWESVQRPRSEIPGAEVQAPQCLDPSALLLLPQLQGPCNICPRQAAEREGACLQL